VRCVLTSPPSLIINLCQILLVPAKKSLTYMILVGTSMRHSVKKFWLDILVTHDFKINMQYWLVEGQCTANNSKKCYLYI
jgi:hypothetical protein